MNNEERIEVNYTKLKSLGKRLRRLREIGKVTQKQIEFVTKMDQGHLSRLERGHVNISINYVFLLADFYGVEDFEILNYNAPLPDREKIQRSVTKFLKRNDFYTAEFFKIKLSSIVEDKIIPSKFLQTPKYNKEISLHLKEKYKATFTNSALSQVLKVFIKKGLIERIKTNKKSKFQYRKK